ncbi:hypothetical protein F5887DRAFT_919598 [Amanita rubescens]|nr:hypothetical protein F5887DRAFT_919598 [Amanita rubescens]
MPRLNCIIKDEGIVFPVTVGNVEVADLKDEIKKQCAVSFEAVDSRHLELWKPNEFIPIAADGTLRKRVERLGDDCSKFADKLGPTRTVLSIFPAQPDGDYVHIIVKVPRTERPFKRIRFDNSPPQTPPPKVRAGTIEAKDSSPRIDRQQTEIKMAKALAGFEKYFEYLATGELDGRLDSIRPEDKLIKFGVHLPNNPILLLHDLGMHPDQERIKDLFKPNEHGICTITHLFSVSGSGKTRLSLDGLCSHWGFYISCRTETGTASGSNDLTIATRTLVSMSSWCTEPPGFSNNGTAAHRAFAMLLLLRALRNADTDIMLRIADDLLDDIMTERTNLFPEGGWTPLFVVIDEAQVAAEDLKLFPSTSGDELRPIIREVVLFFQSSRLRFNKIILSGTGLSMGMVKDATGSFSARAAPTRVQRVFSNVGCFTREDPSQEAYIRRYLTLSDNDISDKRLLERMKFWFSGPYRLTASLIEIFLHSENVPRHRVLTSFAERLTGFKITDAIDLEADEPHISSDLDIKIKSYRPLTVLRHLFEEEGLSNRSELTSISIENNMQEMIALGVGFLAEMPSTLEDNVNVPVYISEPLVVLSLRSIFETQRWTTMKVQMTRSFRNALNPPTLGYVVEMALPLVLMETFGGKFSPLEEAFDCGGKSLGSRRVTLVSLKRDASGELQTCPVSWNEGSADRLGLKAKTPAHVLEFFDNPDGKIFLFPDNHMRLDLSWFFQDEETMELILCFNQSKLTLNSKAWKKAIKALTPQFFYTMVRKGKRVQYAPMLYPDLLDDLEATLKMVLGEDRDASEVVHSYLTRLQSKTKATNRQSLSTSRKTLRFLRIISSPDDDQEQRSDGKDDLVLLRWDKVKEYIGSTADSVVKTIGIVKGRQGYQSGLFFCVCVDANDNELAYLEAIHLFVEILDSFFDNVCELDLVFNFYKVYAILDEIFLAGEVEETSKDVVLARLEELEKLE